MTVKNNPDFLLLNVGKAKHNADWNWKNVSSSFIRIHYIINGYARLIVDGRPYDLQPGFLYLTPAHARHDYSCDGPLSLFYIHIYEETSNGLSIFDVMTVPVGIKAPSLTPTLIRRLIAINPGRELKQYNPSVYDNKDNLIKNIEHQKYIPLATEIETDGILKQLFAQFIAKAAVKLEQPDERIMQAVQYIHANIAEPVMIDKLADIVHVSKDHFIRLFKKEIGCTPVDYVNKKKIEKAQMMLLLHNAGIKSVAYQIGIYNMSYFHRLFKKIAGITPKEYIERYNNFI